MTQWNDVIDHAMKLLPWQWCDTNQRDDRRRLGVIRSQSCHGNAITRPFYCNRPKKSTFEPEVYQWGRYGSGNEKRVGGRSRGRRWLTMARLEAQCRPLAAHFITRVLCHTQARAPRPVWLSWPTDVGGLPYQSTLTRPLTTKQNPHTYFNTDIKNYRTYLIK